MKISAAKQIVKDPKIIAIVNQKGGVGKTTTCVNLATALAAVGKKVLILDLDPQGNASTGFGIATEDRVNTIYDVLINQVPLKEAVMETSVPNLHIVTATMDLSGAEIELVSMVEREYGLQKAIHDFQSDYDYVMIDCPPSLGLLTLNALTATHAVIIPLQTEFFALEGLSHLLRTLDLVKARLNPALAIQGIALTMSDKRNQISRQIEWDVRGHFGDLVYNTIIPRNVRISEAPSHGQPAIVYDMQCPGSRAYIKLARELIKQEQKLAETVEEVA